jgi:hypothetical protein
MLLSSFPTLKMEVIYFVETLVDFHRTTQLYMPGMEIFVVPIKGREGPYICETSRLPHFFSLDSRLTDGGEVVSLTRRSLFTPPPRAIVRMEGLDKLKKIHLIEAQTRDLPACSLVPQPITLPRSHHYIRD